MSRHQYRSGNYATLKTNCGYYQTKETYQRHPANEYVVRENFGSFSLRSAVRPPYNQCWGGRNNCSIPDIPGLT